MTAAQAAVSTVRDSRTEALAGLIRDRVPTPIRRLLVVGCGSGQEAAVLASELGAEVVGIDIDCAFDPESAAAVELRRGDATRLDFADGSFDFVFSYHVLEHIPEYARALAEMRRVLADGGGFCVGTPNRSRLIGYLGSKDATAREKLVWNIADWNARLHGRFRNEFGAHAGFSATELHAALARVFTCVEDVTLPYYVRVYRSHASLVRVLGASELGRFAFPAIYFVGSACGGKPSQISTSSTHWYAGRDWPVE